MVPSARARSPRATDLDARVQRARVAMDYVRGIP
eukprot:COSAG03_NODE_3198_length_2148_cov_25.912328_1_plen_34_part_00